MTVIIGQRGSTSSSLITSSALISSTTLAETYSVWNPNSSATRLMVSASSRWLIETNRPRDIHVPMILFTGTFIMLARSLAVTNSVSLSILDCSCASMSSISCFSRSNSRRSRLYLEELFLPLGCWRRLSVSFNAFSTSSCVASRGWFFLFLLYLPVWLRLSSGSTLAAPLLIRSRLRFSAAACCCALAASWRASRSLRFSSLDFFAGRVEVSIESRSILPTTLGWFFTSCLPSVNISGFSSFLGAGCSAFCSCSACCAFSLAACLAASCLAASSAASFSALMRAASSAAFAASSAALRASSAALAASSAAMRAASSLAFFSASSSILPTILGCGTVVSICSGFFSSAEIVPAVMRSCLSAACLAASNLVTISLLNSLARMRYKSSFIFALGSDSME